MILFQLNNTKPVNYFIKLAFSCLHKIDFTNHKNVNSASLKFECINVLGRALMLNLSINLHDKKPNKSTTKFQLRQLSRTAKNHFMKKLGLHI